MGELSKIKSADHYTEEEIQQLLKKANNSWEYDYIIDRLYFYEGTRQKKRKMDEYEVLTARCMTERQNNELIKGISIEDINI